MSPRLVAGATSACTAAREDTSTVVALTSYPAFSKTPAAASEFRWRTSASKTCLPTLTRRAIAWPLTGSDDYYGLSHDHSFPYSAVRLRCAVWNAVLSHRTESAAPNALYPSRKWPKAASG
jgi:hypothetical protein